ncbi:MULTISPECIES: O-antigen ligase family protein [Rhodopseudomonas]|uniref:LpsH n=1 Tax=Rhodopseudomonas palustris TaxID=1076 RepID=A0A0D7ESD0_RHOPL|nr:MULTISPECIES: O-antigen ligase family protein [Rhodopseudomonas]KIZ42337.1 LpsH [Rhodopseudomonas palustris]MDF3811497.1 O-antigen ligase domain-containing protein [Rhodopseudomonas sp. BAL398]WOK15831.1 O-antigen ligase domain-containing protein [Rhodopseudomonas sp. BAL398]
MTDFAAAPRPALPTTAIPGLKTLQLGLLWLVGASGAIVFIEPSPYEFAIVLSMIVFFASGLRMAPPLLVPIALLIGIGIGYSIGAVDLLDDSEILTWLLTSWYMATTAVFFSMVCLEDTADRVEAIARGYLVGGIIAALAGIAGYFNLVPGGQDLLTFAGRARGTFKDPNVLGAFLVFPALYALQRVVEGSFWSALRNALALGIISLAIFLAFSRAAWGTFAGASLLMLALMFITATTQHKRLRIVILATAAIVLVALAVVVLLSFDNQVSSLFKERASFHQPYDSGRFGRFGRHILGAAMALDYPTGIGPLQFRTFFPEDTHNSFLNAFMSGGWISGILYPALVFTTAIYGVRHMFMRTPWQRSYIAIVSTLIVTLLESFIIDTDHWRHYFMLIGLTWGLAVASSVYHNRRLALLIDPADHAPR